MSYIMGVSKSYTGYNSLKEVKEVNILWNYDNLTIYMRLISIVQLTRSENLIRCIVWKSRADS